MAALYNAVPYLLAAGALFLLLLALAKEWGEYENPRLRKAVIGCIVSVAILTFINLYRDSKDKEKAGQEINALEGKVSAANTAQTANTALFIDSFQKLSKELGDLKTQVKTDALQKKLASVQAELQNTERALAPSPKASLS